MDFEPDYIHIDVKNVQRRTARTLALFCAVKGLVVVEEELDAYMYPAAVMRKIMIEGYPALIYYISRVRPMPEVDTGPPEQDAILITFADALMEHKITFNELRPMFERRVPGTFCNHSTTPSILDIVVAASATPFIISEFPWVRDIVEDVLATIQVKLPPMLEDMRKL